MRLLLAVALLAASISAVDAKTFVIRLDESKPASKSDCLDLKKLSTMTVGERGRLDGHRFTVSARQGGTSIYIQKLARRADVKKTLAILQYREFCPARAGDTIQIIGSVEIGSTVKTRSGSYPQIRSIKESDRYYAQRGGR